MSAQQPTVFPYIPNSAPVAKAAMLAAIGAADTEELYAEIPERLRLQRKLDLPEPFLSEAGLVRHIEGLLAKNSSTRDCLSFLGGGCWQHYVPAVCDEVNARSEFLTAYAGDPYEDHGRFQALFEYASMMGELLDMEVVNVPNYDGYQAAATALRMAARLTGRTTLLVAGLVSPDKLSKIEDYLLPDLRIERLPHDPVTGEVRLAALAEALSEQTAAVYFENPLYLGSLETQGAQIAELAHARGALCVVSVDPITLGVLAPPAAYGADIVCGDIQPLGIHQWYGGGHGGFLASHDDPRMVMEFPSRLFGVTPTSIPGEYGFGDVAYERTSFAVREDGKEWVGTASALWGITAGVYLALMGPQGMVELGEGIMQRCRYAMNRLAALPGVRLPFAGAHHFKEFVVNFDGTGKSVAAVNAALRDRGIFGGSPLTREFPLLGESALYAVTEIHTQADIERLVTALQEILQ
jgi:glycine dehydrogenase subunit 1